MLGAAEGDFRACIEKATSWADFMAGLDRGHMVLAPWCAPTGLLLLPLSSAAVPAALVGSGRGSAAC
jgi:hypothetical protein